MYMEGASKAFGHIGLLGWSISVTNSVIYSFQSENGVWLEFNCSERFKL